MFRGKYRHSCKFLFLGLEQVRGEGAGESMEQGEGEGDNKEQGEG